MVMSQEPIPVEEPGSNTAADESSFGEYLRGIRRMNRVSLEQVAEATRIRVALLRAIEQEDFTRLPAEVFCIGFLRAYAQVVGADGGEAVRRYRAQQRLRQQTSARVPPPEARRRGVSRKLVFTLAALLALIAVGLLAYRLGEWSFAPSASVPASPGADEPAPPPAERLAAQPPSEASKAVVTPSRPKRVLAITAHENSWVKVVIDQGATSEHKLKPGDHLRLEAQNSFNLLIGNVGGVRLNLDDQPVTIPGKRGEVVNIHLP